MKIQQSFLLAAVLGGSAHAFAPSPSSPRIEAFAAQRSRQFRGHLQRHAAPSESSFESGVSENLEMMEMGQPANSQFALPSGLTIQASTGRVVVNAAAIALFLAVAAYQLLHVDIQASVALFEYNDVMEASALETSLKLFERLPLDLLESYEALVPTNPVFYKACTSGVAYVLGDFVSQVAQGRDLESLDLGRTARSGVAGFIGHGPLCHYWMQFAEANLDFAGAWWGTGVKVWVDQTIWSLYLNAMYSFFIGTLAGKPLPEVWREVQDASGPALRAGWRFWPFVHIVSYSHAMPIDLKLLWVDVVEVAWVTILAGIANADNSKAATDDGVLVEEEILSGAVSAEAPPTAAAAAFRAAWPLLVFWPLLFAAHVAETQLGLA